MQIKNSGKILAAKDGILIADGLSDLGSNEKVLIHTKAGKEVAGVALNLEETVGIVALGDFNDITEGDTVETTGELLTIEVSDAIMGRVVDAFGKPLDGKGEIKHENGKKMQLQKSAAGVIARQSVNRPVQTGIKSVDGMIPVGRGQRQLIIGDRQTGKTAIAIDTIINQGKAAAETGSPLVKCIYVAIGQKVSKIAQIVSKLEQTGALEYTTVVLAGASDPAAVQYIAPYAGTAIAEYFAEQGQDTLVVYDDLTKHAWAYREISLLLRRPPGREAYPGDIFYLHSALLERGVQYSTELGGGSLTALPIIETQEGDVSAYIPTNVISITDGQIYLESDLFNAGVKPAINVGLSVSRVGGAAQSKGMKQVAGQLRLDLAQYRALAAFAQFGSDLDDATKRKLDRGARMVELLKQDQFTPRQLSEQVALIFAGTKGHLDSVPVEQIRKWEQDFLVFMHSKQTKVMSELAKGGKIADELEKTLVSVITEFNKSFNLLNS